MLIFRLLGLGMPQPFSYLPWKWQQNLLKIEKFDRWKKKNISFGHFAYFQGQSGSFREGISWYGSFLFTLLQQKNNVLGVGAMRESTIMIWNVSEFANLDFLELWVENRVISGVISPDSSCFPEHSRWFWWISEVSKLININNNINNTANGRNSAPVDMENLPLFTGFYTSQVVRMVSPFRKTSDSSAGQWNFHVSQQNSIFLPILILVVEICSNIFTHPNFPTIPKIIYGEYYGNISYFHPKIHFRPKNWYVSKPYS